MARPDTATCLTISKKIDVDLQHARRHRTWNTFLQITLMFMVVAGCAEAFLIGKLVNESVAMARQATLKTVQIGERQDAYRQQYLDYIKDIIDSMQRLQDANPSLKMPKAPPPRPLGPSAPKPGLSPFKTKPASPVSTPTPDP